MIRIKYWNQRLLLIPCGQLLIGIYYSHWVIKDCATECGIIYCFIFPVEICFNFFITTSYKPLKLTSFKHERKFSSRMLTALLVFRYCTACFLHILWLFLQTHLIRNEIRPEELRSATSGKRLFTRQTHSYFSVLGSRKIGLEFAFKECIDGDERDSCENSDAPTQLSHHLHEVIGWDLCDGLRGAGGDVHGDFGHGRSPPVAKSLNLRRVQDFPACRQAVAMASAEVLLERFPGPPLFSVSFQEQEEVLALVAYGAGEVHPGEAAR